MTVRLSQQYTNAIGWVRGCARLTQQKLGNCGDWSNGWSRRDGFQSIRRASTRVTLKIFRRGNFHVRAFKMGHN
jgi:hypothetical protein